MYVLKSVRNARQFNPAHNPTPYLRIPTGNISHYFTRQLEAVTFCRFLYRIYVDQSAHSADTQCSNNGK